MPLSRIQSVSRRLARTGDVLLILLPVALAAYWLFMPVGQLASQWANGPEGIAALTTAKRMAVLIATLALALPAALALLAIRRLLRLYAAGILLEAENVAAFRDLGTALLWSGLSQFLAPTVIPLLLTFDNPEGHRLLSLGIGSGVVQALFLGGVVRVIAWVMDEARAIADEQAQTV